MKVTDKLPSYLLGKSELTSTVVFAVLFSLILLLLVVPFTNNSWFELGYNSGFGYTVVFFLIALTIVSISKVMMFKFQKDFEFTILGYALWCFVEIAIISFVYTFLSKEGDKLGMIELPFDGLKLFLSSLVYTTGSLGIPYLIAALYFAINDKDNTIRLLNIGSAVTDLAPDTQTENRITLFDNSGSLKFSVNSSNLLYIESDDNYIKAWYTDNAGELKQYMLRCKLKTVEDSFSDSGLARCHRKYVVNMNRVSTLRKEKDGYYLKLEADGVIPIPVSKTYEERILSQFNSR